LNDNFYTAFQLVKQLFSFIVVIVFTGVWSCLHHHNDIITRFCTNSCYPLAVLIDGFNPLCQVKGFCYCMILDLLFSYANLLKALWCLVYKVIKYSFIWLPLINVNGKVVAKTYFGHRMSLGISLYKPSLDQKGLL
jgi:hypothetical protein